MQASCSLQSELPVLELQSTIRTETAFGDLLRIAPLQVELQTPIRTETAFGDLPRVTPSHPSVTAIVARV